MNKEDNSTPLPKPAAGAAGTPAPDRNGPIVQGAMARDSTLKWCVPAQGSQDAEAVQIVEEIAASVPGSDEQGPATPRPGLIQEDCQGALPEPIHEPLFEDSSHPPDSLEIMISEGTVQIETDPAALRQATQAADVAENEATPPPRRATTPAAVDPAWSEVTPPPRMVSGPITPPPRRATPMAIEPNASVVTPPPKPKAAPVVEAHEESPTAPVLPSNVPQAAGSAVEPAAGAAKSGAEVATPPPVTVQAAPVAANGSSEHPSVAQVASIVDPPAAADPALPLPSEDELLLETAASDKLLPPSEMGATPEAPIRMAETAEVGEADLEVMEPLETTREDEAPASSAPPPVPARQPVVAAPAAEAKAGEKKTDALPEALSRRPLKKNLKPWYEEVFDEDYLRTLPFMTAQQTLRETAFIKEALSPPAEGEILDVACGYGRHAIEFGQRGFRVTGLDLSLPLLIRAADESQRRGLSTNFVHADMREMAYENQFDAAYCVLTSFGYFDEETNLRVASSICRALKPGGRFLVDIINRDYIVSDLPSRVWWEGDGCVVLEEVDFDFHTSRVMIRRSIVFGDGRQVEHEISIRAYSLHELARILRRAGFEVLEVSGSLSSKRPFLGYASRQIVLVCERPLT